MLRAAVEWFLDPDNEVATSRQWRSLEGAELDELRSALDQPLPDGLDDAPRAELQALLGEVHRLRLASGGAEEEEPTEKIDVLVFVCSPAKGKLEEARDEAIDVANEVARSATKTEASVESRAASHRLDTAPAVQPPHGHATNRCADRISG